MTPSAPTEVAEVLTAARALILKGWAQNFYAVDRAGLFVSPTDEAARAWCLSGAVMTVLRAGTYDDPLETEDVAFTLLQTLVGDAVTDWNDAPGRTQTEVVEILDKAIERAMS